MSVVTTNHFTYLSIDGQAYTSGTTLAFDQATAYSYELCVVYDSEHACITLAKDAGSATLKAAAWRVLTLSIQSNDVVDGGTSSLPSVDLTFTASEPNAAFTQSNITVTNGSVSNFSIDTTTEFSATITPSGDGLVQVDVPVGLFSAPSFTPSNSAASYSWTYVSDNTPPTMTITATEVSNGGSSLDASLSLTFTASEPTDGDFDENDLVLTNGTISAFTPVSSTVYTATFTPDIPGVATISVPDSTFTDGAGNDNLAATPFTWTYAPDTTAPTMSITATGVSNGDTTDDASLALTFTANEPTTDFVETDITLSGGTLSAFTPVSSTVYTATFTPTAAGATSIAVNAATFTDGAGNDNLAATPFTWTYDPNAPTMSITATGVSNGDTTDDASLALTFTANEPTTDFVETDITLSGGTLSAFTPVSSTVYTATFTPTAAGATSIAVNAATFTDGAGNDNLAATPFTWTYDPNAPTMSITATGVSNGDTTDDASLALTFTANEPTTDFVETDITLSGGTLSAFTPVSSTVYTATFTPTAAGATSIAVNAATFTDGAGNDNLAATPFTWTYGSNPVEKADVTGTLKATAESALRFTNTSFRPVIRRLSWLRHNPESTQTSRQGIKVSFADPLLNAYVNGTQSGLSSLVFNDQAAASVLGTLASSPSALVTRLKETSVDVAMAEMKQAFGTVNLNPTSGALVGDWSVWTEGEVTVGKIKATRAYAQQDTDSVNLAIGLDRPYGDLGVIGVALNVGQDTIDVGRDGSQLTSDNLSINAYNAKTLPNGLGLETQIGIGKMAIDTIRKDGTQTLTGDRDAKLLFGSVSLVDEPLTYGNATLNPYGRAEWAYVELNPYQEVGGSFALTYNKQKINRYMLLAGTDIQFDLTLARGHLRPFAALEYGLDLTRDSEAGLRYVSSTTQHISRFEKLATSNVMLRLGAYYQNIDGLSAGIAYERNEALGAGHSDSVKLQISKTFD